MWKREEGRREGGDGVARISTRGREEGMEKRGKEERQGMNLITETKRKGNYGLTLEGEMVVIHQLL